MPTKTIQPTLGLWRECWKRAHGNSARIQLLNPTTAIVWNNPDDKQRLEKRAARRYK